MDNHSTLTPNQIIIGERLYEEAIQLVLASAKNTLLIFDQDLSRGNFASLKSFNLIQQFLSAEKENKLTMVLHDTAFFKEKCPRLYQLLEVYGHKMTIYETDDTTKHAKDCFILADGQHYIKRIHIDHARFKYAFDDAETVQQLQSRYDELLAATQSTVSITTLGL